MEHKNDERYWNINLLNKWFAVSSILFLLSIGWMFLDDNDDEFKEYQREFRQLGSEITQAKLLEELNKVENERDIYEKAYSEEKIKYDSKKNELDSLNNLFVEVKGIFYKSNMDYLFFKAEADEKKYLYESEIVESHNHKEEHHKHYKYKDKYELSLVKLIELKLIKERDEKSVENIEDEIKSLQANLKVEENKLNKYFKEVVLLETKIEKLDRSKMSIANQIGDIVRDLPIIDFLDPYYKVNQLVVNDVKYDVNFASVPSVERCTSCHLGIDNPDFVDAPQPFTSHPRLDLYVSSSSTHTMDQFGCTSCHAGRARGTTFVSSSHTPESLKQEKEWIEKYEWEKIHHWLQPMLPTKYTQASCFNCHESQPIIDGGEKLALGLGLISAAGCNNCHHIETYEKENNAGPPLTQLDKKLNKEWVSKWIKNPQSFRYNTWMPHFFEQENNSSPEMIKRNNSEIYAITEYLFPNGEHLMNNSSKYIGNYESGEKLFKAVGCMGCHQIKEEIKELITQDLPYEFYQSKFGYESEEMTRYELLKNQGPNLIGIGSKSDAKWIYNWIKNPFEYYPETRMPDLRLSHEEASDITAYLLTLKNEEFSNLPSSYYNDEEMKNVAMGWLIKGFPQEEAMEKLNDMSSNELVHYVGTKSINFYGCYTCHDINGFQDAKPIGTELTHQGSKPLDKLDFGHIHSIGHNNYSWFEQKLANPRIFDRDKIVAAEDKSRMPNFYFKPEEIEAMTTALLGFNNNKFSSNMIAENFVDDKNVFKGYALIQSYNCQGCHIIDDFGGQIADIIGSPEFSPPNLNTQGIKTQPDWLFSFFNNPITIRPNLQVRMPSFRMFSNDDWNSIIKAFQDMENHNLSFEGAHIIDSKTTTFKAGEKLHELGACNNCHFYGEIKPIQGAVTWAPNLALTKDRLRHEWVVEWLNDPQKIMPGTKMPAPYIPTSDILSVDGAEETWGKDLVELNGDIDLMVKGLTDYIYNIPGKVDISNFVREYFKTNGYDFDLEDENEDEDDWDEDW